MAKMVNICDVCSEIFAGGDAPKNNMSIVQTDEYNIPIYSNGEVNDGLYGFTNFARVSEPSITVSARGTIGYTSIRNTPFVPIVRLITLVPKKDVIDIRYLFYAAQNYHFDGSGTSIPQLTVPALKKYNFPLPTIAEQKQIVIVLDKICHLITLRKKQLSKLDELVKSRFVELFANKDYEKVTVSSVLNTGFWLMPATPEFIVDGEVPYITSKNIKNRTIDFDNVKYISKEAYKSISANRPTQKGDILVSMIGTLGQTAVIQDDREFYGQNLYLLRLNNSVVDTTYFCEFFNSDTAQHELQGKRNQSTQAYLKANHVENLVLPLAPLTIQKQFAAFVEQTDESKLAIQQSLEKLETLKKALMQQYFE